MKKMIIPVLLFVLFFLGCSNPTSSEPNPAPTEDKKVTVSYDSRGGSTVPSQEVQSGGTVETLPVSEKFSYHFGGWYTEANGGGEKFLADTAVTADITVYASWVQTAVVTTLAGGVYGSNDGTGTDAYFKSPYGVSVDTSGNIYVADHDNHSIRKISSEGVVTTLAGSGTSGWKDGAGTAATFFNPSAVAVDNAGNVYVADTDNNSIRKIIPSGFVVTLAGSGMSGSTDGPGTVATFNKPYGIAVDSGGNVYVADDNHLIRKITPSGIVSTLAGSGKEGSSDGTGTGASFKYPAGVAVDSAGNLYVGDSGNNLIRKITPAGVVTTFAGSGTAGSDDGTGTAASFNYPWGIAIDRAGNVYVADFSNCLIRKITSAGVVTTLAGSGTADYFYHPVGVTVDSAGTVYVADKYKNMILKITQ